VVFDDADPGLNRLLRYSDRVSGGEARRAPFRDIVAAGTGSGKGRRDPRSRRWCTGFAGDRGSRLAGTAWRCGRLPTTNAK
jgi:hypothetical protein